ncbi:MAG TPA: alanine racemase [Syntrophomonadaceae bacterium]|nr:alanine racemase [Syntrophomonadaceae bacterium]HRX22122.1 alanine racemase [Syntrophomonadaceae bacterium]
MYQIDKWLEIDLAKTLHNLNAVRSHLPVGVKLIAVIKADAYGHGAVKTAQLLCANGVDFLAVTYLEEALALREAGIDKQIMVFSPLTVAEQYQKALEQNITITIASVSESLELDQVSRNTRIQGKIHLKIDTGLGRFGLNTKEAHQICQTFNENPFIEIEGIYTHMADAARSEKYTNQQFRIFIKTITCLEEEGYHFSLKHCANSSVFLKYPHMLLQAVRIGTLLTGQYPAGTFDTALELQDPYRFKSRIVAVYHKEKGSYLGYYRTYRLKHPAQIAVVPVGYVDGLALAVQNPPTGFLDMLKLLIKQLLGYLGVKRFAPQVKIKGANFPLRGKVFMQNCLVELPDDFPVRAGDEVELPVRKTLAGKNIPHIYIHEEEAFKSENNPFSNEYVSQEV